MNNYMPTYVYSTIYDIDFSKLYAMGKKIIIADLDNTLLPYYETKATIQLIKWNEDLHKAGFKLYIATNNNEKRINEVKKTLLIDGFITRASKPSPKKVNQFLYELNLKKEEVLFLGDQLVTDILCANRCNIDSILVKTIDLKHQKWYTKINRIREKKIIKDLFKIDAVKAQTIQNFYKEK